MPTFTVKTADLAAAIKRCSGVIEKRCTIPVLRMVRASFGRGVFNLVTTDLDFEAHATGPAVGAEVAEFLVDFDAFTCAVDALKTAPQLRIVAHGDKVDIFAPDSARVYTLPILAGDYDELQDVPNGTGGYRCEPTGRRVSHLDDFPDLACIEKEAIQTMTINGKADMLHDILALVETAMSEEETRYYLNGIYLYPASDGIPAGAVATDGHRLNQCDLIDCETAGIAGVILPRKAVGLLQKILKSDAATRAQVAAIFTEKLGVISGPNWRIVTKLIDGTFPDFWRVIPAERADAVKVTMKSADLVDFAKAAKKMTADRTKSMALIANGRLDCLVKNPERGELRETIAADIIKPSNWLADDSITVGVNSSYIAEIVGDLKEVTLQLIDPASPIRITSPDLPGVRVVMPLRV